MTVQSNTNREGLSTSFGFLVTALLRFNSHTIEFAHLKCKIHWVLIYSEMCNYHHNQFQNIFITSERNPIWVSSVHSVMSDSATPWTVACQASLSIANSWSLLKLMSIEMVMPHPTISSSCHPLLPLHLQGWINKIWYIHTIEYYSAFKRKF